VNTIDAYNLGCSPNYPDELSPGACSAAGVNGIIAAHVVGQTVVLFFGLRTAWNIGNIPVVMPAHILKYFNVDKISNPVSAADLSGPWKYTTTGADAIAGLTNPSFPLPANSFINYLPNLNFGTGPFILSCIGVTSDPAGSCQDYTDGTLAMDANPYYFNSNWQAQAVFNVASGSTYTPTFQHIFQIYNPGLPGAGHPNPIVCGPATPTPIATGSWGNCELVNPFAGGGLGTVKVYTSSGILVRNLKLCHYPLTDVINKGTYYPCTQIGSIPGIPLGAATVNGGNAGCTVTVIGGTCPSLTANPGQYEIVIQAPFTFKIPGVSMTSAGAFWYQQFGFTVS